MGGEYLDKKRKRTAVLEAAADAVEPESVEPEAVAQQPQATIHMACPAPAEHAHLPVLPEHQRNVSTRWTEEEEGLLVRLVQDEEYRVEVLGTRKVDWELIGRHLGRLNSHRTAARNKYWALDAGTMGEPQPAAGRTRNRSFSFAAMAISALQQMPDREGTFPEICKIIEVNPAFQSHLDWSTSPGTLHRSRWHNALSSASSASHRFFYNTGTKRNRFIVWRLIDTETALDYARKKETKQSVPYLGQNHR
ncbi:hypothetical protein WJX72_006708 [[Myrmecia] bisecta]|uniref:Myb-like domain-containing protein n=1 Tax=[Myrmecia] bisecta TaxID=41462 RepID=A0AAW1PP02_9CHLO